MAQFVETELLFDVPIDNRLSLPGFGGTHGAILLTGRSTDRRKLMSIYEVSVDGYVSREPMAKLQLSDEILFFDTGFVNGTLTLLLLSAEDVLALDPVTGDVNKLFGIRSVYRTASTALLARLDFTVDVNDDGLDDIVVPDFDGLRVVLQTEDGFDAPILPDIKPRLTTNPNEARYRSDPLHRYDFNFDGIRDLAVVRNNEFIVFDAESTGSFNSEPRTIPIDISLADDDEVARFEANMTEIDQSDFRLSQISRVADLNKDGLPDIITFTAVSSGVFEKSSEYRVHLAIGGGPDIRFRDVADAEILSRGLQVDLTPVEIDTSGPQDLVSMSVDFGFRQLITALFTRSVVLNVGLHRFGTRPLYASEPDYRAKVKLRFDFSTGFISNPAVRFADFNGDGHADLLLQNGLDEIEIKRGSRLGERFHDRSWIWETRLPLDGTLIEVADTNGDEMQDILVGYGSGDGEEMTRRLRVLVSRLSDAR